MKKPRFGGVFFVGQSVIGIHGIGIIEIGREAAVRLSRTSRLIGANRGLA